MTLNTLADLFGPSMLTAAQFGIVFCLGWFSHQVMVWAVTWAWPEVRFRYRRRQVQRELLTWGSRPRQTGFTQQEQGRNTDLSGREPRVRVMRGKGVW